MPNFIGVRHTGVFSKDPAALAAFYQDVMGMAVVRQTTADAPFGATLFLVRHPDEKEDHDVVFVGDPAIAHTAYEVESVTQLKAAYREIKERVPIKMALNHGNQLSFYLEDPEGHLIEIYWVINVRIPTYVAEPIDLDLPEEELLREVERVAAQAVASAPSAPR